MELDLKKQKSSLESKKVELEQSIADLTEAHPKPISTIDAHDEDLEDIATDFQEIQEEQSILVNQQALLTQVEGALQRLADGTYGLCAEDNKPIPPQRLVAIPWAERCVMHEELLERQNLSHEDVYDSPQIF
jgi:DnaK suppressor protein